MNLKGPLSERWGLRLALRGISLHSMLAFTEGLVRFSSSKAYKFTIGKSSRFSSYGHRESYDLYLLAELEILIPMAYICRGKFKIFQVPNMSGSHATSRMITFCICGGGSAFHGILRRHFMYIYIGEEKRSKMAKSVHT